MRILLTILFLICLFVQTAFAQKKRFNPKQRFQAGLILGLNASQIDGDNYIGYDKLGIMGGMQAIVLVNRKTKLVAELLYTQKGAKTEYVRKVFNSDDYRTLTLNMVEVPFLIRVMLNSNPKKAELIAELETGFSFSRLIKTDVNENPLLVNSSFAEIEDELKENELNYLIGGHLEVVPNLNLGIRASIAITKIYSKSEEEKAIIFRSGSSDAFVDFRNYHLTLYASYQFK